MKRITYFLMAICCLLILALPSGAEQSLQPEPPPAEEYRGVEAPLALPSALMSAPSALSAAGPPILGGDWVAQGPGPTVNAQVQNLNPNNEVSGAIHAVVAHPTNADILYVGAVNGGVWLTTNATAGSPTWTPLTDFEQSLTIGALEMDPGNANILLAGYGRFSSFGGDPPFQVAGGPLSGLLYTTDGGNNWIPFADPLLVGEHISAVAARGAILLAGANDFFGGGGIGGLFRSTNTGGNWTQITGGVGTGLPAGTVDDLAGDPTDATRLYVALQGNGIYITTDTGANWTQVSDNDATLNGAMGASTNTRIAVAGTGRVFALVTSGSTGITSYIGYSDDQGLTWTQMDVPGTAETALQGRDQLMAIVVDPGDDDIVYVSAISQRGPFNNSVGATSFHAHMFRGDVTRAQGLTGTVSNQWDHLTHATGNALMPNGGTAGTSAPHADSREMAFDANGNLIEVGDGGVVRRTSPGDNTGDWSSINGDIQVTEAHSAAYDTNFDIITAGTQDTGAVEQSAPGSVTWNEVLVADGGKVAVSDSIAGTSVRYFSTQRLNNFTRRTCNPGCADASPGLAGGVPALVPGNGGNAQFYSPLATNPSDTARLLIGALNNVYESTDQGNTVATVPDGGANVRANSDAAMVYGHPDNVELIYLGAGSQVFVRTTAGGTLAPTATAFPGGTVFGVAVDPADEYAAYVIDNGQAFQTIDGGTTWTDITGNIAAGGAGTFRAIAYVEGEPGNDKLVVGTNAGVMVSVEPHFNSWFELGEDLPYAPVWDLDYDATDDILVAGTLGRGVWTLAEVSLIAVPVVTIPGSAVFTPVCNGSYGVAPLYVCNTGKADLLVESIDSSDPQFVVTEPDPSGYPVAVSPDFCFPFEVIFTPTGTAEQTATLTVTSNDPAYPEVEATARGITGEPKMTATLQAAGNFGSVQVGQPKILNLQVVNQSSICPLEVTSLTRSAGDEDFSFAGPANGLTLPVDLPVGQAIDLPIQFLPTGFTPPVKSATFTLTTDDPDDSPLDFGVTGESPAPEITVSGGLGFGAVCPVEGGAPAEQTVEICNEAGVNNLAVDAALAGAGCGDFAIEGNPFPADLSPDFCIPLTVQYTPTGVGDHNDCDLVITSNDPDEAQIDIPVSGSTPAPVIDVAEDQGFAPTVIQSVDACSSARPFPIQNNGSCPLKIKSVTVSNNDAEYSLSGLPSVPVEILPGELFGEGDLRAVFAPDILARTTSGEISVTYVNDPVNGTTDTITRDLCGEAVRTGARVLVTAGGAPLAIVKSIKLQRLGPKRNKNRLDTIDNARNLALQTVTGTDPCASFQYHREYATVSNPIQLAPGSYVVTVQARINGKNKSKTVGFDVSSCDFNPNIVVDF